MNDDTSQGAGKRTLRVAVPSERPGCLGARRSCHFGHCECFTIVDLSEGKFYEVSVIENLPHSEGGCMAPVMLLADHRVDAIVVDGIGGRPLAGFNQVGISVHAGLGETVEQTLHAYALDLLPVVGLEGACRH